MKLEGFLGAGLLAASLALAGPALASAAEALPSGTPDDKAAFAVLSLKDGLSNTSVSGIVQDSKGFIWLSTQGGLCRYDGSGFKVYENEPFNENSLSGDLIQTLFLDRGDVLWIGTYNGLNRLDTSTGSFRHYRYSAEAPDSLSNDLVIALARDARGALWVGTLNGLNRLDEASGSFSRYYHDAADPHSLPNNTIRSLFLDSAGRLWVGTTGGGLASYDYDRDRFESHAAAGEGLPGLPPSLSVQSIAEGEAGELWIGAWGRGLVSYRPDRREARTYRLPDDRVYVVNTQERGRVRVGTWGGGLHVLEAGSGRLSSYRSSRAAGTLPNDVVYSLFQDASGELWIGTNGGGVARLDRTRRSFTAYVADSGDPGALPNGKVIATLVDSRGGLWVSVYSGGVHLLEPGASAWRHFRHDPRDPGSLANDICNMIYEDREGTIWIATNDGLSRFDRARGRFSTMRHAEGEEDSLSSNIVYSLLEDPEGNFWIGTYTTGLEHWDRKTGRFRHYPFDPENPASLSDNLVNALAYDEEGRLWIGTNNGLNRLEGGGFVRYHYDPARKDGISSNSIQRIKRDSRGVLWIATRGGGVNRYLPESDGFAHFMRKDGLSSNIAYSILEDRSGDLWIVTQTGIVRYDRETGAIKRVTLYKELENASFNAGSCEGPNGELYFGSIGLVAKFDPAHYETNLHVPPVYVTELRAANQSKLPAPLARAPEGGALRLAHYENSLEFRFAALDYRDPAANQFAYRLEGFDRDWTYSSTRNFAAYTNLPGGRYVFRVRAANNDGVWNEEGASLPFLIATSPFLSWPAIGLYLLAIAFFGYGVATLRSNRLLAAKVRELTTAEGALKAAGEESARLALEAERANRAKSDFVATVSHELRTPLNGVVGMAELLERTSLDSRQEEYVETIRRSGETLISIINDVLDFSKIEAGRIELEEIPFEPRELAERTAAVFAHQAAAKRLLLETRVAPGLPPALRGDPLRLGQVLANLVGNAVKFTDRGLVRLELEPASEAAAREGLVRVLFRVSDTGIGIRPERLDSIFSPFTQEDQSTTRRYGGSGLGLSISKRFVELMGGELRVESEPGRGSSFSFALDLAPAEAGLPREAAASWPSAAGLEVLVVDDDEINRLVALHFLEALGSRGTLAESGHAAITELGRRRFDLVLMDCSMPGMDGYETTRRIRASGEAAGRDIPIVALSASVSPEDRQRALEAGMDDFLVKPVTLDALAASLGRLAPGAAARRAEEAREGPSAFDRESFDRRYASSPELAREILGLFLGQSRELFEEGRAAWAEADGATLSARIHRLKGGAGALGGMGLVELADRIMRAISEPEEGGPSLDHLLADFDAELERFEAELRDYLERRL